MTVPSSTTFEIWKGIFHILIHSILSNSTCTFSLLLCNSHLYSFPGPDGTMSVRFNSKGSRLLCNGNIYSSHFVVYDLPTNQQVNAPGKVLLKDPCFGPYYNGSDAYCFAGLEDDLVISGSNNHDLLVWSLPDAGKGGDCTVGKSFHMLCNGHNEAVQSVRCSNDKLSIVSCGDDGLIKLWTTGAS